MQTIVIEIRSGLLVGVASSCQGVQCIVLDDEDGDPEPMGPRFYPVEVLSEAGTAELTSEAINRE